MKIISKIVRQNYNVSDEKTVHTFSSLSDSLSEPPGSETADFPVPELVALRPSVTTSIVDVRVLVFFHE